MSDNLIDLVKDNYFSLNDKENEAQIANFINEKCINKSISETLNDVLEEINQTLNCDYIKSKKKTYDSREEKSKVMLSDIIQIREKLKKVNPLSGEINDKSMTLIDEIRTKFVEITKFEDEYDHLLKQEKINELLSCIQSSIVLDDMELASEYIRDMIKEIDAEFSYVSINQINLFFKYYKLVKEELTKDFRDALKDIKWPFVSPGLTNIRFEINRELIDTNSQRLSNLFYLLTLIELPVKYLEASDKPLITLDFLEKTQLDRVPYPIELMLLPFVKQFNQYFWTENKMNKVNKPEWYINQILQWIGIHQVVLSQMFMDDLLDKIDVQLEFNRALIILVMEKVSKDLPIALKDDSLFFHLIEESLTMCVELKRNFDYPSHCVNLVDVICDSNDSQINYFEQWMHLEFVFAKRQMDELFLSGGAAWKPVSNLAIRVECLSVFTNLLESMKERIECVNDPQRQLIYCRVLLEVLKDFRFRLVQVTKQQTQFCVRRSLDVMNVLHGVCVLMRTWKLEQIFISVHEYESKQKYSSTDETEISTGNKSQKAARTPDAKIGAITNRKPSSLLNSLDRLPMNQQQQQQKPQQHLFSEMLELYQHNLEILLYECSNEVYNEIVQRAMAAYTSNGKSIWLLGLQRYEQKNAGISKNSAEFLLVLRDRLHTLSTMLESPLFDYVWRNLAIRLNQFFYNEIIVNHRFSEVGALQLDYDLRHGLITLFSTFTKAPQRFFENCLEACTLLTINWGAAVLLRQLIESEDNSGPSLIQALQEAGVFNLSPNEALNIIKLRVDPNLSKK